MKILLHFFCLLAFTSLYGQNLLNIQGKVTDAKSGQPVAYAHVGIPELGLGTTTSNSGSFVFKVDRIHTNKKLEVSFIGYKNYTVKIANVKKFLNIKLEQVATDLMTVEVIDEFAIESIIRKAIKAIPQNYPTTSTNAVAFYRQSRTNKNDEYLYLAEGVLDIYKSSYKKTREGQTGLVEGRQVILADSSEFEKYSYINSGHVAAHRFDFVKHREDFINEKYFPVYKYSIENVTMYNGRPVYIIAFEENPEGEVEVDAPSLDEDGVVGKVLDAFALLSGNKKKRKVKEKGRMKGRIFIEKNSYAFIRAEFKITEEGLKKQMDYPLYSGNWKGNKYVVNYRKLGNKWYFGSALREGITSDGGLYSNDVTITEIKPGKGKTIDYNDRLFKSTSFLRLTGRYEADFWENYNTTELDVALAETVEQKTAQSVAVEAFDLATMAALQRTQDSLRIVEEQAVIASMQEKGMATEEIQKKLARKKKIRNLGQFYIGAGTSLVSTGGFENFNLSYLNAGDGQSILQLSDIEIPQRDYEILIHYGSRIFFQPNLFFDINTSREFGNSYYRNQNIGIGGQVNLSKGRPFFVRAVAGWNRIKYARFAGEAINEWGDFDVDGKSFGAARVNMYYGKKIHNINGTLELAIELRPNLEIFAKGSYVHPIASKDLMYLKERGEVFRRAREVKNENLISANNIVNPSNILFFSIGVVIK